MKKYFIVSIIVLSCLFLLLGCTSPPLGIRVTHASSTEEYTNTSSPNLDENSIKQYIVNYSNDYDFVIDDLKDFQIDKSEQLGEIPDLFESDENAYTYQYYQVICSFNIERPLGTVHIQKDFLYANTGDGWEIYTVNNVSKIMSECNIAGTWTDASGDYKIIIKENPAPDSGISVVNLSITYPAYQFDGSYEQVTFDIAGEFYSESMKITTLEKDGFSMYSLFNDEDNTLIMHYDVSRTVTLTRE